MQLRVDDYILCKRFGIGRISSIKEKEIDVSFSNGETRCLTYETTGMFYSLIPNSDLLALKEMLGKFKGTNTIKARAEVYADLDHFSNFTFNPVQHKLTAICKGTNDYSVTLFTNSFMTMCTCPYYDHCKHEYALLLLLNEQMDFSKIDDSVIEDEIEEQMLVPSNIDLNEFAQEYINSYLSVEAMLKLYSALTHTKSKDAKNAFVSEYFNRKYNNKLVLQGLFDILVLSSPSYINKFDFSLITNESNSVMFAQELDAIETSKYFSSNDTAVSIQYYTYECLVLKRYRKYFDALYRNKYLLRDNFTKIYLYDIYLYLKSLYIDLSPLFRVLCMAKDLTCYNNIIKDIYDNFNSKERASAFLELPTALYDQLTPSDIIDKMNYSYNNEQLLKLLLNSLKDCSEEERIDYFNQYIAVNSLVTANKSLKILLKKFTNMIPPCEILDTYLLGNNHYYPNISEGLQIKDLDYENDINLINYKNFELYFNITGRIEYFEYRSEFTYREVYSVYNKYETLLFYAVINEGDSYINIDENKFDVSGEYKFVKFFIAYINLKDELFIKDKNGLNEKLEKLNNQKIDNQLINTFKIINQTTIDQYCKQLSQDKLVGLEYHFFFNDYYEGNFLQFKIGINKMYAISNIRNLISNFIGEKEQSYGKNLAFKHTVNNMKEEDREIVKLLMSMQDNAINAKYLMLNEYLIDNFLNLLKGRVIYINDKPFVVRLDRYPYEIKLDENYILSIPDINTDFIFKNGNTYYYLNKENGVVDILEDELGKIQMIELIISMKTVSIKRVKKEFIQDVYPIYENDIHVDEKIASEFVSSSVKIDAYFDINKDNEISMYTRYFKNEKELKENEITIASDIGKLNKYKSMIIGLGFENNLLIDQSKIFNFFSLDFTNLKQVCDVYLSNELSNKKVLTFTPPTIRMSFENNLMQVLLEQSQFSDEELYAILNGIKNKKRFVLLKDDHIIDLQDEEVKKFADTVSDLSLDNKHLSKTVDKPIYQTLAAFSHLDNIKMDDYLTTMVTDIKGFKKAKKQLPELNAKLRSYQKQGYNWLKILTQYNLGGILADDMGLGKTLETISLIASDETQVPSLIVAPKSLVFNWIAEFDKFAPYIETKTVYGNADQRYKTLSEIDPNKKVIYLTSYDSLRNDIEHYDKTFNYLILDEAQYIKNVHALKTIKIKQVEALHRFALTGTPIENDIFDLWSIFDFLMPGYLPNLNQFKEHGMDDDFKELIARRVAPFILRRTKQDVLKDLPEKFERVLSADMTTPQRKIYDAMSLEAKQSLDNDGKKFDVLHLLMRLRQICVDPSTFMENFKGKSGKMELLKELILEYISKGHRILIFSQFVSALNIVEKFLNEQAIKYFMITGKTKGEDRINFVNEFNKNEDVKIFLISLKAGGNGLNLVGSDTVIHLDPWWNLAAENQATDRAYRIGQTKNVEVIRLISENSIEQRVIELQYKKKDLIDKLISDDTSSIEKMSVEDLKFILD